MNFAGRLILGTILITAAAIAAHVIGVDATLRQALEQDVRVQLEREVRLMAAGLPADSSQWQRAVVEMAARSGHRVTLIDRTGRVRAESAEPVETIARLENHAGRPEVRAALAGQTGSDRRTSATVGEPLIYVAIPVSAGALRVAATLDQVEHIVGGAQRAIFGAAAVALVIAIILATMAGRSIAKPLTRITLAAREIAQGAQPRFPPSGIPDVDALVRALRDMHQQLEQRFTELRRERAESAALVESMTEGVIAADARGTIVTANQAARRLLGYEDEEALPVLSQLFRAKAARELVDTVLAGSSAIEQRELELDGSTVLISGRALPLGGALLVLHDVSELRRLETVRRDFVANVSHELKTPLTSISGYAETLVNEPPDAGTTRRFLDVILANARRMQRLVDGLLDLSRIESGGWRPEPVTLDAGPVAREVWSLLSARAGERQVQFETSIGKGAEQLRADPDAFRQVLSNLFDNALRHSSVGGRVTLRTRREDGGVLVGVRDTGSGISREHLPRIFERFYRADPARAREDGGTGLGLAIVKHLVEAHGGSATATSEVGRGTEISCWFPDGERDLTGS
jgi:PAS domain S-box-containing protein